MFKRDIPEGLSQADLSEYIYPRGTGHAIPREKAIVYDFMPMCLGEQFRTSEILSRMLLRPAPETAPFMLQADAYEKLGERYIRENKITPALECYRIALGSKTEFTAAIARLGSSALLNPHELEHLNLSTNLEKILMKEVMKSPQDSDQAAYSNWIEDLRVAQERWLDLNHKEYGSATYVEACLSIGKYEEARTNATKLGNQSLLQKVKDFIPVEILDVQFLKKYIDDNYPESTFGRERRFQEKFIKLTQHILNRLLTLQLFSASLLLLLGFRH